MFRAHGCPSIFLLSTPRSERDHAVEIIVRRGGGYAGGCKQGCVRTDANEREPLLEAGGGVFGVTGQDDLGRTTLRPGLNNDGTWQGGGWRELELRPGR